VTRDCAIAKAEVDAAEVSETRLTQLKGQAMAELESERGLHLNAVRSLRGMLEATENALSRGDNLKRRAHSVSMNLSIFSEPSKCCNPCRILVRDTIFISLFAQLCRVLAQHS